MTVPSLSLSGTSSRRSGGSTPPPSRRGSRGPVALFVWCLCALLLFVGLCSLGVWQVERRSWKLNLIKQVNERVHAEAVAAPGPDQWARINSNDDEYLHVRVTGRFLADKATLVNTGTKLGTGYWLMTPLRRDDGTLVLINRGYVPEDDGAAAVAGKRTPPGPVTVIGLLRTSQPGGDLFRDNKPAENRWYSRDVQAIAAARGLPAGKVAPYFIDAGMPSGEGSDVVVMPNAAEQWPVGGLTVIHFRNSHLGYAITWFGLALLVLLGTLYVVRIELLRRPS